VSEVKRYSAPYAQVNEEEFGLYVRIDDYTEIESELAALREELATERLRADVAVADTNAAEQRNAELNSLLTRTLAYYTESCFPEDLLIEVKIAIGSVKPTESGASE
jgi:hypothetical protein